MAWREIHITTTAAHVEMLSEQMTQLGAQACTLHDAGNQPIYEPAPNQPAPVWPDIKLVSLFDDEHDCSEVYAYLNHQQAAGSIIDFTSQVLADEDWERRCLDDLQPMRFGKRLWICPSWLTPPDPQAINIILDPGLAFGTGTHPTTALCLEWLDENFIPGQTVIDYGCGSGILALAALKLGASKAIAIDYDDKALQATRENATRNQVESTLETYLPDGYSGEKVDLLIANILAQPLIEMARKLANLLKPGGKILLSGILKEQIGQVNTAYSPWILTQAIVFKEEWCRLVGVRQ
ncbi:MAG: 50S ribosomal protein L11 methyltransferase [Pseudomonadota bacterium]